MSLSDLFTDLEVLSMIKENDKICVREGHIAIEQKSHPAKIALRRWYHHDSRRTMIMEINKIITQSLSTCKELQNEKEKTWTLEQFKKHFSGIKNGLLNLQRTYHDDATIVARLNVLNDMLEEEVKKLNSLITSSSYSIPLQGIQ